ncbi:hypothetical protein [uncultured Mucilaginibacter sp.]|uniref:hypothetical protein n=1 Tax=uncultured Mucilaginibacter sp. TaxID=797541 RepID=UPI0025E88987|nr:hypothetical protein [uncultured Mucilaginibacter sp.]
MKSRFLFPFWFRYLGTALFLVHVPFVFFKRPPDPVDAQHIADNTLFNNGHLFFMATTLLMAVGLFFIAFAKEKIEDEQISQLRLDSLQWAIYLNYFLLIIGLILTTDTEHILFLNLMVPLFFFIVRFRWVIFKLNHSLPKEG